VSRAPAWTAALACCVVAAAVGGCSDDRSATRGNDRSSAAGLGKLVWDVPPRVFTPDTLPDDRILSGQVRNDSLRDVQLTAKSDLKLVDRSGRDVAHTALFTAGYSRDIYPPRDRHRLPEKDAERLGYKAKLRPGDSKPLTVSWREGRGRPAPVRIELPSNSLNVPK
jgi:hypothetical protein